MKAKLYYYSLLLAIVWGVSFGSLGFAQGLPTPWLDYPDFGVGITSNPINLNWHLNATFPAGATYHVQVATDAQFTSLVLDVSGLTSGLYPNFVMSGGITYQWRVRLESHTDSSAWSPGWFTSSSSLPVVPPPAQATVKVGSTTTSGSSFSVPVKLDLNGASASMAYSGTIKYTPANFVYTGHSELPGTIVNHNGMALTLTDNQSSGTIVFVAVGTHVIVPSASTDTLFNLNFNITGPTSSSPDSIRPSGFNGYLPSFSGFSYVNGLVAWTTPLAPSTLLGDADGNGVVDFNDAILVQQEILTVTAPDNVSPIPSGALITVPQYRINADVTGNGILDGNDVTGILDIILGITPLPSPRVASGGIQISPSNYNESSQITLPIQFVNASNMTNSEIMFKFDPTKIQYQTFASQVVASGYFVNAQQVAAGQATFFFASPKTINGNLEAGNIVLQFANGTIPVGSVIETEYSINGGSWQTGPKLSFGVTGIQSDQKNVIPDKFEVSQNYPNPFNPTTEIQFALPQAAKVSIKIYNMLGQEIKTLYSGDRGAGTYTVQWNGDNNFGRSVASGTYIYRVVAGQNVATKKMVLLK